ncbi:MAG: autotransporter outer membrane beta-barrel domain-containing protein, partial [Planctomycetes bacterium]|nr:autotransporter outer membrane beta-barrel domain-containing protein [Planctomycetota bacterium]
GSPAGGAPAAGFADGYASYGGPGLAIWGMPLYQNWNAHGLPAGGYDLDGWGWLAGGAVGADWTFDSRLRLGAAFDFGAGNAEGGGDFNRTLNDMSFWGVNLYGGWKPGAFGVFADVGFSSGWNRFRQNLPPELQMADLEAGIASWALSTGLRAEYEFHTDIIDAIPHVGVRYSHLKTEQYSLKSAGLTVLEGDAICQNVWSLPIGVTFARNFALGRGWALRLSVDARITPNMGDVDARGGVSFTGVSGQTELRTQVMDYVLFGGTAGAELRKGERLRLGAHYDFEVGDHSDQHGVFATLTWRF